MKVLMVNKFLFPNGGSETYIFKLGEELIREGHEVQYFGMEHEGRVVGNKSNAYTTEMDFHTKGIQKLLYPFRIIYSREAKKKIEIVLHDFQPDVVHLNNFNFQLTPSIIYAVRKYKKKNNRKVRIVFTAHDYQLLCPNHMMRRPYDNKNCKLCMNGKFSSCTKYRCIHGSFVKSILGTIEAVTYQSLKTYRFIDTIICPSQFMANQLSYNPLFTSKVITLHNFIDRPNNNKESDLDAGSQKKEYVIYFGRFAEEKGIRSLLTVCGELPQIPFIFAGSGPLEHEIAKYKNIKNVGFKNGSKLETLIREARFSVYPSEWYENGPFSVMESQVYGTPMIGASIGGIPELIQNNVTGELFESGNVIELKEKIENLWNDRERLERYTQNCKKLTFDSTSQYCKKLIDIYIMGENSNV